MDKQIAWSAAGLLLVTVLGAYAGSGPDRGVVHARGINRALPASQDAAAIANERIHLATAVEAPGAAR